MPRFPTAGSRSADSSARKRGGTFGRCSHASEGSRTCTSRDPRTWTRWLQAEPVVELHQQDVGGPVEEQLPLEVPVQVERGIIRPGAQAALCPNGEERGAGGILPRQDRVGLERARAKVGILEREPLRGRRGGSVGVDDVARETGAPSSGSVCRKSVTAGARLHSGSSSRPSTTGARSTRTAVTRSEEHTSELQSRLHLVCRLLLEKKKKKSIQSLSECS